MSTTRSVLGTTPGDTPARADRSSEFFLPGRGGPGPAPVTSPGEAPRRLGDAPRRPRPVATGDGARRTAYRAVVWVVLLLVALGVVIYPMGPLFSSRDQVARTDALRLAVGEAYGAANNSLAGADPVTRAPVMGTSVALLQIPRLAEQQAVAEGADSSTTRGGVGHVPGSAGPGQPGNSILVGRAAAFGAPFADLSALRVGDQILCTTTQGRTVYTVTQVGRATVGDGLYEPTSDDRLTLVTSGSRWPWNSTSAVVVTATLQGSPFVPTPQNGYATVTDGRHGDGQAWALLVLELLAVGLAVVGAVLAHRRWSRPMASLVTTPALLALTVFVALTASRLLPGWT